MASEHQMQRIKLRYAARKLPVVGQYQDDEEKKDAQNTWFTTKHPDSFTEEEVTVAGYFKSLIPDKQAVVQYVVDTFPFVKWVCNYNLQWFLGDLIAGITVGAVVIPQVCSPAIGDFGYF
jgi:hypothetical protein